MKKKQAIKAVNALIADTELATRPLMVGPNEQPIDLLPEVRITEEDEKRATRRFERYLAANFPALRGLLDAEVDDETES